MTKNRRLATAMVALVFVFVFTLSFPSVRAAASEFLGMFRVQKFAAISITPDQLAILEKVAETGAVPGEFEFLEEPGQTTAVESFDEAVTLTGLNKIRTLADMPFPDEMYVIDGGSGRFTIDLEGARVIVEAVGSDPALLSDNLDGATIEATVYPGVEQDWENGIWLMQTESPLVEYPEDLDPFVLGESLLQMLGMTEEEAQRLAQEIDWTSTLLLPIPQEAAVFEEVFINGNSGLALRSLDGVFNALLWQQDGRVYVLSGDNTSTTELLDLAGSLR